MKERFGERAAERYLAEASADLRMVLTFATKKDAWVDFALFVEATELADKLFGRGDLALAWDMGRFGAEHNAGVWRSLVMRLLRPQTIIGIGAGLWSHHYDSGRLVMRASPGAKSSLQLQIADFAAPHRAHCLSVAGWLERTLELGGPKRVAVREDRCRTRGAASCDLSLEWE